MTPYPERQKVLETGIESSEAEAALTFAGIAHNGSRVENKDLILKGGPRNAAVVYTYRADNERDNNKVSLADLVTTDMLESRRLEEAGLYTQGFDTKLEIIEDMAIIGEGEDAVIVDMSEFAGGEAGGVTRSIKELIGALLIMNPEDRKVAREKGIVLAAEGDKKSSFMAEPTELYEVFLPVNGKLTRRVVDSYVKNLTKDSILPVVMLHAMAET